MQRCTDTRTGVVGRGMDAHLPGADRVIAPPCGRKQRASMPVWAQAVLSIVLVSGSFARAAEGEGAADVLERARQALQHSAADVTAEERERSRGEALALYQQAYKLFAVAEQQADAKLKAFPAFIEPQHKVQIEARDAARADAIQAQLRTAGVLLEMHEAHPQGSEAARNCLQQAADKFESINQRFRTRLAGHLARVKQGECYAKMGDTRRALGYWADTLQQPDDITALRPLKASAMRLSLECWLGPHENRVELAAQEGEKFLANTQKAETPLDDFLAIRYYTALAYFRHFRSMRADQARATTAELDLALEHAAQVAEHPGRFQEPARTLAAQLRAAGAQDRRR